MELGLLAVREVVVAVPDPRPQRLEPITRLRHRPQRVLRRLALEVDRPLLGRRVARRAVRNWSGESARDVDVDVVRVVGDRVVRAGDPRREQPARPRHDPADETRRRRWARRREVTVVDVRPSWARTRCRSSPCRAGSRRRPPARSGPA